ncbi:hypothetical protein TNIN_381 [Trichonephila inaurata madagascariensis]|uniref:Uncharacterized protein n=1 Tax=Trichonephila inaurata madagascariensis TaxID=2747483 RepID=A0A8X6XSH1_9ARAC|nr:hypothetical protein TNIN_113561 [Trichonephila inaurata madagascariensis]GFY68497.1 hypothetical protein TNIN_381 [Trichonephila inaurata madagascariensis]
MRDCDTTHLQEHIPCKRTEEYVSSIDYITLNHNTKGKLPNSPRLITSFRACDTEFLGGDLNENQMAGDLLPTTEGRGKSNQMKTQEVEGGWAEKSQDGLRS